MIAPQSEGRYNNSFGAYLKALRKAMDLTQKELAQITPCSLVTIKKLESDELRPSKHMAERLAECLDICQSERATFVQMARSGEGQKRASATASSQPINVPYRGNLPAELNSFIGRADQLERIYALLNNPDVRLLTLTGGPGTGKTRLALRVAWHSVDDYANGVYFVPLAAIDAPARMLSTIARTLNIGETPNRSLLEAIRAFLYLKQTLLVLDNFEHIVGAAHTVVELLETIPGLKIMVTSRTRLKMYGEHELKIPPLSMPAGMQSITRDKLRDYEAIALFLDRALAVRPNLHLDDVAAGEVVEICRTIDGLPLAIELAAGQMVRLSLSEVLRRLNSRLSLLTGGAKNLPLRQQTLRAALAWSYALLNPDEQKMFRHIALFVGGCNIEAVEAILSPIENIGVRNGNDENREIRMERASQMPYSRMEVRELLASLCEKSLLHIEDNGDEQRRYFMLETIREYGLEQLDTRGERGAGRREHAAYFLEMINSAEPRLWASDHSIWIRRLDADFNNILNALKWAEEQQDGEKVMRFAAVLGQFCIMSGHLSEGRKLLTRLLGRPYAMQPSSDRSKALRFLAAIAIRQEDRSLAQRLLEQSLAVAQELQNKSEEGRALLGLGVICIDTGEFDLAQKHYQKCLAVAEELGDKVLASSTVNNLGQIAWYVGDHVTAIRRTEESLALSRELGDEWSGIATLRNLGHIKRLVGKREEARYLLEESLATAKELGAEQVVASALLDLADVAREDGNLAEAKALYRDGLTRICAMDVKEAIIDALEGVGILCIQEGMFTEAAQLLGGAANLRDQYKLNNQPVIERAYYEQILNGIGGQTSSQVWADAWEDGRLMASESVVALAMTVL